MVLRAEAMGAGVTLLLEAVLGAIRLLLRLTVTPAGRAAGMSPVLAASGAVGASICAASGALGTAGASSTLSVRHASSAELGAGSLPRDCRLGDGSSAGATAMRTGAPVTRGLRRLRPARLVPASASRALTVVLASSASSRCTDGGANKAASPLDDSCASCQ